MPLTGELTHCCVGVMAEAGRPPQLGSLVRWRVAWGFIGPENVLMVPDARPAGRWEPTELGVHPVPGGGPHGPMPAYIRRPHDELLRAVLDPEVAASRLIVVRGETCDGKSRAG